MKKPFEPLRLKIKALHVEGYGITDDPKIVVLGALPEEELTVLPFTRKKRKLFAKPLEIHQASIHRVDAPCAAASYCGGCSLQHLSSKAQIQHKFQFLLDTLGDTQAKTYYPPILGPTGNYRTKARLGVKYVEKKNRVLVGFREKMKPYIADISACHVLRDSVSVLIPKLINFITGLSIVKDIPQIEVAVGDEEVALVFRHLEAPSDADMDQFNAFGADNKLSIYLQPGNGDTAYKFFPDDKVERLFYALPDFDLKFGFHPLDFTQVNQKINQQMVNFAIELLALKSSDKVFDAFCGIGNFSLALARKSAMVLAIEASETSIQRAKENADKNTVENCVFRVADLFSEDLEIPELAEINKVLLDPPRSGAMEVCKRLASTKVERVVYVSCNPVTLARDARILVANGYQLDGAGVIDMFPHTNHVESIACFSK